MLLQQYAHCWVGCEANGLIINNGNNSRESSRNHSLTYPVTPILSELHSPLRDITRFINSTHIAAIQQVMSLALWVEAAAQQRRSQQIDRWQRETDPYTSCVRCVYDIYINDVYTTLSVFAAAGGYWLNTTVESYVIPCRSFSIEVFNPVFTSLTLRRKVLLVFNLCLLVVCLPSIPPTHTKSRWIDRTCYLCIRSLWVGNRKPGKHVVCSYWPLFYIKCTTFSLSMVVW